MEFKNLNKNKKGEFLARDFMISLVLFGAVMILGYLVIGDIASSKGGYNVTDMTDENFEGRYDTLTESSTKIYQMQNASASEEGISTISAYVTFFKATFSVIPLIFGSLDMAKTSLTNFAADFGIPSAVANIAFSAVFVIIVVILVFVIISSVSKGRL